MKSLLLNCALMSISAGILFAQEPALPKPETQNPTAESTDSQSPLPTPLPQLIPPDVLPLSERVASPPPVLPPETGTQQFDDSLKRAPVNSAAEASRKHIAWRELRNRIANDVDLKEKLKQAEAARTDLEKRRLLRRYYEAYYARLTALAATPEMKAYLIERKDAHLGALPQPRVRPEPSPKAKR